MEKTKIIIIVQGGLVQAVHANKDIDYAVVDLDNESEEPVFVGQINEPDIVIGEGEKFHKEIYKEESKSKEERIIHEQLKEIDF